MIKYFKVTMRTSIMFLAYTPEEIEYFKLSKEIKSLKVGQVFFTSTATWERLSKMRFALETL